MIIPPTHTALESTPPRNDHGFPGSPSKEATGRERSEGSTRTGRQVSPTYEEVNNVSFFCC